MTDNEIIKALECCLEFYKKQDSFHYCDECPLGVEEYDCGYCKEIMLQETLDLINRQKAENEKLKSWVIAFTNEVVIDGNGYYIKELSYDVITNRAKKCKAEIEVEAIKEFAEEIKIKTLSMVRSPDLLFEKDYINCIDNVVKEMVGDNE
jgi:hypothetical protein